MHPSINCRVELSSRTCDAGLYFNASLQARKDFHNPSILDKIAKSYDIDPYGTHFTLPPPTLINSCSWRIDCFALCDRWLIDAFSLPSFVCFLCVLVLQLRTILSTCTTRTNGMRPTITTHFTTNSTASKLLPPPPLRPPLLFLLPMHRLNLLSLALCFPLPTTICLL